MSAPFTDRQFLWLAVAPKIVGALSFLGSSYILYDILSSRKKRRHVYHHIILSLSLVDIAIDVSTFLSTWPMPSDTPYVYGPVGNTRTCTAQGFFLQLAIIAPLYNASLSLYYLLMIRYGWVERRLKKLRWPIQICVLTFGIGAAVAGLFLTLYNNALLWCWQASYPPGCVDSSSAGPSGEGTCTRGDNANTIYRFAFFYAPLWAAISFATVSMLATWWSIRQTVKKTEQSLMSSFSGKDARRLVQKMQRKERNRNVAIQCLLYLGAFYVTWTTSTILRVVQSLGQAPSYGLVLSVGICIPIQGLLNFIVYIRPRYQRYRKANPAANFVLAFRRFSGSIFRLEKNDDDEDYNVAPEDNGEDGEGDSNISALPSSRQDTADVEISYKRSQEHARQLGEAIGSGNFVSEEEKRDAFVDNDQ